MVPPKGRLCGPRRASHVGRCPKRGVRDAPLYLPGHLLSLSPGDLDRRSDLVIVVPLDKPGNEPFPFGVSPPCPPFDKGGWLLLFSDNSA
jgi:hypothetical protein